MLWRSRRLFISLVGLKIGTALVKGTWATYIKIADRYALYNLAALLLEVGPTEALAHMQNGRLQHC